MKLDALVAEIGSTTTVVTAFDGIHGQNPHYVAQGIAPTSVSLGDVTIGLNLAIADLEKVLKTKLTFTETFAASSAAGGLKMSVHGLVYDMTVKAAKEAALGAGANLKMITAGMLDEDQLATIKNANLNIILIAGGVDFGDTKTALQNARMIANLNLKVPVIYAGNMENQDKIKSIFQESGLDRYLFIAPNVYPKIDLLQVDRTREIIQNVFEEHIIKAPGMEKVREVISQKIIPTPGAVLKAAVLLYEDIGDLLAFDVGGATTDVHSVTPGSERLAKIMLAPEPLSKRTVEGDLGVYINKDNLVNLITMKNLVRDLKLSEEEVNGLLQNYPPIPTSAHIDLVKRMTTEALKVSLERHVGHYISLYGPSGKMTFAEGKDLTNVKYIISTGGALTKLPGQEQIVVDALETINKTMLIPAKDTKILIDHDYCMASCGVLASKYPEAALRILKNSLRIG